MTILDVSFVEEMIGYEFKNKKLLQQAFVKPSCTKASDGKILNYQVLEFLGDAVLNLSVVYDLINQKSCFTNDGQFNSNYNENDLTKDKIKIVRNSNLEECSNFWGFSRYLQKTKGFGFADKKTKKGDEVESILGAIAIDSDWNLKELYKVCKNLLTFDSKKTNYCQRLISFAQHDDEKRIKFVLNKNEIENSSTSFLATVYLKESKTFSAIASTELDSKNEACKIALAHSKTYKEFYKEMQNDKPLDLLNCLHQKNIIDKPVFSYKEEKNELTGDSCWLSELSFATSNKKYSAKGKTKADAKLGVVKIFFCDLFDVPAVKEKKSLVKTILPKERLSLDKDKSLDGNFKPVEDPRTVHCKNNADSTNNLSKKVAILNCDKSKSSNLPNRDNSKEKPFGAKVKDGNSENSKPLGLKPKGLMGIIRSKYDVQD